MASIAAATLAVGSGPARAQRDDNKGTEFILGFMSNLPDSAMVNNRVLFITGDTATSGVVEIPGLEFAASFAVTPGNITPVNLPEEAMVVGSDVVTKLGIRVSAEAEIVVYGLNQRQYTTDAFVGLPTDILGTEHIVLSYQPNIASEFLIVGVQDGTKVNITPSVNTGDRLEGVPYGITLDRFSTYQLRAVPGDLTGTTITSDQPVAVFGGNDCVAPGGGNCDHIVEQLPPTSTWGVSFLAVSLANLTSGDLLRVIARDDATEVFFDGSFQGVINRGEFLERDLPSDSVHTIETTGPALVAQYAKGIDNYGPLMMLIPPTEQFLNRYTVTTPAETPVAFTNFINVVVRESDVSSCSIDGGAYTAAFTPIGTSGFSAAREPVAIGFHTLSCPSPFGAYAYGFAAADSYGYPGGLSLEPIADEACELTPDLDLNPVGGDHTVTARLTESVVNPLPGVHVTFGVDGSNEAAEVTCSPNPDCTTDENGEVSFTYSNGGGIGVDRIHGSFVNSEEETVECNPAPHVLKFWDDDCNENGIPDTCDLSCAGFGESCVEYAACGESQDLDENGIPDECPQQGILLSPGRAHLEPGAEHKATASVRGASGEPLADVMVTFEFDPEGQYAGEPGSGTTNENGEATFTYTGDGQPGWDRIIARAKVEGEDLESNQALVLWGSGIRRTSDWAEAFDLWTYEDEGGVEHRIGFLALRSAGVHVLDVTNPLEVQPIGSYEPELCADANGTEWLFYADEVTFVEAQGESDRQTIHVSTGACGVHIVDVTDAANPQLLEVYDRHVGGSQSWVEAVAVHAGIAYVADYDALRIFDVSDYDGDPGTAGDIAALGTIPVDPDVDGPAGNVVVYEDDDNEQLLALVATGDGMRVVNVDDPDDPYVIGTHQHDRDLEPWAISQDIAVDSEDPAQPRVLLPAWNGGLSLVDISDMPADPPPPLHEFGLLDSFPTVLAYYTAVPYAGKIYATEGTEGLRVLEFDDGVLGPVDPDPIEVGSPGEDWAWDVVVDDCIAYVTFGNLGTGAGGLQLTPLPLEACQDPYVVEPQGGQTDGDVDGVADAEDNCLETPNADQTDSDLDGFGNACDADSNGDGAVDFLDYLILAAAYDTLASDERYDPSVDLNADGAIDLLDYLILSQRWGSPPGPSGLACAGTVPCP